MKELQELINFLKAEKEKAWDSFTNDKGLGFRKNHTGGMIEAFSFCIDKAELLLLAHQPNSSTPPQLNKTNVSGSACDLLRRLKEANMCSVIGDELIDEFFCSQADR